MSDFLWYARLLVWVGCGGLLLESIAGRSFGLLTLLSVAFVVVGLLGFIAGLALENRSLNLLTVLGEAPQPDPSPDSAAVEGMRRPGEVPPTPSQVASEEPLPGATPKGRNAANVPSEAREAGLTATTSAPSAPQRVETRELGAEAEQAVQICLHCGRRLVAGQLIAECWRCGALHHAVCWTENRFHCARAGCEGEGSLEAPRRPPEEAHPG